VTDRPDAPGPAGETPDTAEVRRLLAAARHTEPMPPGVVARLDDVLAGLSSKPPVEPAAVAPVVPLATRRRLRHGGLLVAAAAVVVGGVVGVQHLPSTGGGGAATTAGGSAEQGSERQSLGNSGNAKSPHEQRAAPVRNGRVVVHPKTFAGDALFGRRFLGGTTADSTQKSFDTSCTQVPQGARTVPARYRHAPAVLVYRVPAGSGQVVDLYVCGNAKPVRSTTLPAP